MLLAWSDNEGMRRWMFMAALSATLFAIPLWGQRAGRRAMAMGGMQGGYVAQRGGAAGASGGAYLSNNVHGVYGHGPYGAPSHYSSHLIYFHYPYYRLHYLWSRGYPGYYGYPVAWGWYGGVGMDWSSDPAESSTSYGSAPPGNSSAYVAYDQQQQIERLNDEVARLRAERVSSGPENNVAQPSPTQIPADTVLVFRDHSTEEIQNIAIVGKTLWVLTKQRAHRFLVADLDLPATTKANQERGVEFRLPTR